MSTTKVNFKMPIQRVYNMQSVRSNSPVANQYIIDTPNEQIFQSYQTVIAVRRYNHGQAPSIILDADSWDYSRTTVKYLHKFLGTSSKREIEQKLNSGEYATGKLN